MRRYRRLLVGALALVITVLMGRWGKALFTTSEFVHFSVNFPTAPGVPQADRTRVGGPWTRLPEGEWRGFPTGGLLVWGREGRITVDLGGQGILKRLAQPDVLTVSSHWLRNIGVRPYRICLGFDACGMPVTWDTFERDWDNDSRCATRQLSPGETFNMDWILRIPEPRRRRRIICESHIDVIDADSGGLLTRFPVSIIDSKNPEGR